MPHFLPQRFCCWPAARQRQHGCPHLTVESSYPLQYAKQFTVDECTGGYELITIADSQYLVVPQGVAVPEDLPQGTTVLQQPIENIYLVSTSAMDPIISLGALDSIALSGTKADAGTCPKPKTPCRRADCLCGQVQRPGL